MYNVEQGDCIPARARVRELVSDRLRKIELLHTSPYASQTLHLVVSLLHILFTFHFLHPIHIPDLKRHSKQIVSFDKFLAILRNWEFQLDDESFS